MNCFQLSSLQVFILLCKRILIFDREMAVALVIQGLIHPPPVSVYRCSLGYVAFDNMYEDILIVAVKSVEVYSVG